MVPTELLVTVTIGLIAVALSAVIGTITVLGSRISDVRADMGTRFDAVDRRFDAVDRRFDGVDRRFERLEDRLTGLEDDMTTARASLGAIDARLTTLER